MRAKLVIFNGINEQCREIFVFLYNFLLNFATANRKRQIYIMIRSLILVALGGGVGSALRFWVSKLIQDNMPGIFPCPTLTVNLLGCLLIGLFYGLSSRGNLGGDSARLLLTTGLCGGFTTFSTFCNENLSLMRGGHALAAFLYAGGSVMLGFVAVAVGYWIAERV